jgi:tetratricopeptide (TPR) repeat protein
MGGLPLALDQAGGYIKTARCSFQEYVNLYRKHRKELLVERGAQIPEHPEPVATTWDLSFQRIERENPAASELLRLCAFLAPDAIPEKLLVWGTTHCTSHLQKLAASDKPLKDAIKTLYSYSLVQRDLTTHMLMIHRLVQAVLIDAMPVEIRRQWQVRVIRILNAAFPGAPFQEWVRCGQLLPHVHICALEIEHEPISTQLEAADLFDRAGSYLREQGQYPEAESLLLLALSIRKRHLSADDLAIATSLSNLAGLYFYQDRYQQAASLVGRAFAIRQQRLGAEHYETTESMKHLALLYLRQEQYERAEPLLKQSLAISERHMGDENPGTTNRMNNLAILYLGQERYEDAEPLLKKAFSINKRHLGAEHPETARTMENLALLYVKQGRYRRAEPLLYRALCIHAQKSGLESPDIAYSIYGLAELYRAQKKYEQSEQAHQRALSIRQQHLGEEHLDIAESLQGLADLYREWTRYEEAMPVYVQALAIREKILGWESPSLLKARQAYVAMLQIMERDAEAK